MNCLHYDGARLKVSDPSWVELYVRDVTTMVQEAGGRYLTRTTNTVCLEGEPPQLDLVLLIEWPSREAAMTFYESEEYRPHRSARQAGARNEMLLVPGEDITGTVKAGPMNET